MQEVALLGAQVDELINRRQQFFLAAGQNAPSSAGGGLAAAAGDEGVQAAEAESGFVGEFSACHRLLRVGGDAGGPPGAGLQQPQRAYDPQRYCDASRPGSEDLSDAWRGGDLPAMGTGSPPLAAAGAVARYGGGDSADHSRLEQHSLQVQHRIRDCAHRITERRHCADRWHDGVDSVGERSYCADPWHDSVDLVGGTA